MKNIDVTKGRVEQRGKGNLNPPEFKSIEEERRHGLERLASAFRMFAHFGFDEGLAGHITLRDPDVIKAAFEESGLDAEKLMAQMQDAEVKAKLISNTEAAAERGVFGIPTFFVGDEMYFGKDNLWQVEEKLSE